jgi:hypothetical protein
LEAGAYGEHRYPGVGRLAERGRLVPQIARDNPHFDVLTAVEEDDVELREIRMLADSDIDGLRRDSPPRAAAP